MFIKWDDNLSTGITKIDDQHKEIFNRINNLMNAISDGDKRKTLRDLADFLSEYVDLHFKMEEDLMLRKNYPGFLSHKRLHDGFIAKLKQFQLRLNIEGTSSSLISFAESLLVSWWYEHINQEDKRFGVFLKK
jgi:hemerythrin